jgi:hypothetical protein
MLDCIKELQGEGGQMEQVRVERLDHLGLIASVIKDLGVAACEQKRAGLQTATLFDQRSLQTRTPLG